MRRAIDLLSLFDDANEKATSLIIVIFITWRGEAGTGGGTGGLGNGGAVVTSALNA